MTPEVVATLPLRGVGAIQASKFSDADVHRRRSGSIGFGDLEGEQILVVSRQAEARPPWWPKRGWRGPLIASPLLVV
ncbi:MAG: hypothetical protein EA397_09955 [Deltaproteobacteria bacterium]|nr:MAG: hypothetical protein EA397_09955 [Deltaproteobacteria bacterium]